MLLTGLVVIKSFFILLSKVVTIMQKFIIEVWVEGWVGDTEWEK